MSLADVRFVRARYFYGHGDGDRSKSVVKLVYHNEKALPEIRASRAFLLSSRTLALKTLSTTTSKLRLYIERQIRSCVSTAAGIATVSETNQTTHERRPHAN